MHKLYKQPDTIEAIFRKALVDLDDVSSLKYCIPYLPDSKNMCPIGLCLQHEQLKTVTILLNYLSGMSIDHHSKLITKYLPKLLDLNISTFVDYMDSRNQETNQTREFTRYQVNQDRVTPGIMACDIWTRKGDILDNLFTTSSKGQDIKLYFIDTVGLHEFGPKSREFFTGMANTDMLELFDLDLIQRIILFKWPITKEHMTYYLLLPHFGYLITNIAFTSNLLHDRLNSDRVRGNWIFNTIVEESMLIFSGYFLSMEILQMRAEGYEYFKKIVWNGLDLIPPTVQLTMISLQALGYLHHINTNVKFAKPMFAIAMSISTMFIWLKLWYFLRIFESTGFLVRAILIVISEMRYFLLILLLSICAFGDSYKVMDQANNKDSQFLTKEGYSNFVGGLYYTYLIGLGEFGDGLGEDGYGYLYCKLLFLLNTVFTTIIVLNLFIAIISESFARINE